MAKVGSFAKVSNLREVAAAEIEKLRGLLHRQYRADAAIYSMPHDCTEEQWRAATTEHHSIHLLLAAEFETDSKPDISEPGVN